MGSGAVKTIVLLMVLVVLSFLVGAQVSDSMKGSMSAFAIVVAIAAAFGALVQGGQVWKLLYFLPAFVLNAPIGASSAGQKLTPIGFALATAVLGYGVLMWGMGYVRFRWRSVLVPDLLVLLCFLGMLASFICYPVSIGAFDADAEYVGGKEYAWCAAAALYYLAISSMSGPPEQIVDTVKKTFYVFLAGQLIYIAYGLTSFVLGRGGVEEEEHARFGFLVLTADAILYFLYSKYTVPAILGSVRRLFLSLLSLAAVVFCGSREPLVALAEVIIFLSLLKREFLAFAIAGVVLYAGLFVASSEQMLIDMPYSAQRVLSVVPGMTVRRDIARRTEGSSETRRMVWQLGMDTRTGYIKDYIWGDGFQTSVAGIRRGQIAFMRGTTDESAWGFARSLAAAGNWHNGWLSTVHRIGLVGLVWVNLIFICGMAMLVQVWRAYAGHPVRPHMMALCLPFVYTALSYPWGTQILVHFFAAWQFLGLIKLLYCSAREEGRLKPFFRRDVYVPLMVRDLEMQQAH